MLNMILSVLPVGVEQEREIIAKHKPNFPFEMTKRDSSTTLCMISQYLNKKTIKINQRFIQCFRCLSVIPCRKINLILVIFFLVFFFCFIDITKVNEYWNEIFENFCESFSVFFIHVRVQRPKSQTIFFHKHFLSWDLQN